ncbi:hypothetical protein ACWEGQ_00525 [Streptomyces seoulensis]
MTESPTIGSQLDALGLHIDLEEDERVVEATVTLVTGNGNYFMRHRPVRISEVRGENHLVPNPVERHIITVVGEYQELSSEQLERVQRWLIANGIEPRTVAQDEITLEFKTFGPERGRQFIGFHQYYLEDGEKVHAEITNSAVTFRRYVEQTVELADDPSWEGWTTYYKERDRARQEGSA